MRYPPSQGLRRRFCAALLGLATVFAAQAADTTETETPILKSGQILEALRGKDIVLDTAGAGVRPGATPRAAGRRDPAVHLQVRFTFDSAELLPQGKRQLDELAMALGDRALARWGFLLAGHTDRVGAADYNVQLSLARAESVKAYLVEAHRIDAQRLQTLGYGYARPIDAQLPNAAINRRVEVRRIALPPAQPAAPETGGRLVPTPR
ncbi:OmpA family protein [Sphaerotilus mobilis]|uniref:OmpA family protein n=1 Tax=Sphaerotilus mobilis TaxID=47994 RepID=A0A4Q7LTI3_9BURK|nr:OmpA family protein [Sphaerotilus mobilis]RZS57109.1 OmpA family protein [Sphaerotilus mobilis]